MYQRILHGVGKRVVPALIGIATAAKNSNTRSDYWEHDPSDFDYYVTKPTAKDLPILMHKFDVEGLTVWPWVSCYIYVMFYSSFYYHYYSKNLLTDLHLKHKLLQKIWIHPNTKNGPHHVFVGMSEDSLDEIQRLAKVSDRNNILIIANKDKLEEVASKRNDPDIYERCQCGLVVDSELKLLNHESKILMLDDERVIAFDRLILV